MPWRHYEEHDPVARRPCTCPVGWPVCALAPHTAAPLRTDAAARVGSGRGVGRAVAALPRGSTATRTLGRLKKQLGRRHAAPAVVTAPPRGFVAVPPAPSWPPRPPTTPSDRHRADGTRLCIHSPESSLPLAAVVRAFLAGRYGCSSARTAVALWPPHRWMFAQGLMGSRPCADVPCATPRWQGPSPSAATAPARRAHCCCTTARGMGAVCNACRRAVAPGGRRLQTPGGPWRHGSGSCCGGMAIPSAPRWPEIGAASPQAGRAARARARGTRRRGQPSPAGGALAAPPGTPPHCPRHADRWRADA